MIDHRKLELKGLSTLRREIKTHETQLKKNAGRTERRSRKKAIRERGTNRRIVDEKRRAPEHGENKARRGKRKNPEGSFDA